MGMMTDWAGKQGQTDTPRPSHRRDLGAYSSKGFRSGNWGTSHASLGLWAAVPG